MSLLSDIKEVVDLIKKLDDQVLLEKILTLKEDVLNLKEENLSLRENVKELESALEIDKKLVRKWNYYCIEGQEDPIKNDIYCLACWDHDRKLINLLREPARDGFTIFCNICDARKARK